MTETNLAVSQTSSALVSHRSRDAVGALFRIESVRLLRHPAVLTGIFFYLALWAYEWGTGALLHRYPILQDEDRYSQVPLLLIAVGAFVGSNLIATRAQRSGVASVTDLFALAPWLRTLAQLLMPLPLAVLSGLLVSGRIAHLAAMPGAVGQPSPLEMATGPLVVLLAGVAGVAVGRLTPMVSVSPLVILGMAVFTLVGAVTLSRPMLKWWGPAPRLSSSNPANPCSAYRSIQRSTVGNDTPANSATSLRRRPSAIHNTIRARVAMTAGTSRLLTTARSSAVCSSVSITPP